MSTLGKRAFANITISKISVVGQNTNGFFARGMTKFNKRPCQKPIPKSTLKATKISLQNRGFLRPYKPYAPPKDVSERVNSVCKEEGIYDVSEVNQNTLLQKFKLLTSCEKRFNYSVPNSVLYGIETVENIKEFYSTPISSTTPLDALKEADLPKNLHIRYEYHRFHPDTDTFFNGKTAFPRSSTIVTGLKYKDRYAGHKQYYPEYDFYRK